MSFQQYLKESLEFESYYYHDEEEQVVKVKARDKKKSEPKIMFARWGHMNPKRDKKKEKRFKYESMHTPPEHKGIYAFIWPYIEPFLVAWNKEMMVRKGTDEYGDPEYKFPPIKKFQHHGDIWTHFIKPAKESGVGKEYKGSWVKVHTKDLPMLLGKVMAKDASVTKQSDIMGKPVKQTVSNPYKIGKTPTSTMTRDHLEVFIPGKVRESK